jgi:competence protein ComEA
MKKTFRCSTVALAVLLLAGLAGQPLEAQKGTAPAAKISINAAGADQLASLPGVGPATAQRIVEFRSKNGPFKRLEDLMAVQGIGEKKFAQLKDSLTL